MGAFLEFFREDAQVLKQHGREDHHDRAGNADDFFQQAAEYKERADHQHAGAHDAEVDRGAGVFLDLEFVVLGLGANQ
ncbi:hypothetical protein D3C72_266830 [compost metagenome]